MMNLKTDDIIQTCCETPPNGAQQGATIQPDLSPEKTRSDRHPPSFSKCAVPVHQGPQCRRLAATELYEGDASGYNVLYMHDGQNLFEPQKSFIGVDWGWIRPWQTLCQKKEIRPTIVVGIWNTPQRLREYLPQRPFCDHQSQQSRSRVIKRYGGCRFLTTTCAF
jgi:hypothetical protein